MKRTPTLLSLALMASTAAAQNATPSRYFGIHLLGVQATYDAGPYALRLSAGSRSLLGVVNGVGADVAALYPLYRDSSADSKLSLGAGVDVNYYFSSLAIGGAFTPVLTYRPHVLLNYELPINNSAYFFIEPSVGYLFNLNAGGTVYPGLRLGLNFR